jgi:hypothetical protein
MGIPVINGNLDKFNVRHSFKGVFNFLCSFPQFGGCDNKLAIYLQVKDNERDERPYFCNDDYLPEDYKIFFIYKLAQLLFDNIREFLFRPKREYSLAGTLLYPPNEKELYEEDYHTAQIVSFAGLTHPSPGRLSRTIISDPYSCIPKIKEALLFFKNATYIHNVKPMFDRYLDRIEKMFNLLVDLDCSLFTAFYKIDIPFEEKYEDIVSALSETISADTHDKNWTEGVIVDFEWFSAGETHLSLLFSAIFQRFAENYEGFEERHVILCIDEPEMHMHPEAGRTFIDTLNATLKLFRDKGLLKSCQVVLSTHSPFIIQKLSEYNSILSLATKEKNDISIKMFDHIKRLKLPQRSAYSFNLVMYHVFGVPTIELHNELYGVLQEITTCYTIKDYKDKNTKQIVQGVDSWFKSMGLLKTHNWIEEKDGVAQPHYDVTLQTYIRNFIHHPENKSNLYKPNPADLKKSVDEMLALLPV